jgi:hypothetical protein
MCDVLLSPGVNPIAVIYIYKIKNNKIGRACGTYGGDRIDLGRGFGVYHPEAPRP